VRDEDGDAQAVFRVCGGGLADAERRAGANQCSKLFDLGTADSASYCARLPGLERISQAWLMRRICRLVCASGRRSGWYRLASRRYVGVKTFDIDNNVLDAHGPHPLLEDFFGTFGKLCDAFALLGA